MRIVFALSICILPAFLIIIIGCGGNRPPAASGIVVTRLAGAIGPGFADGAGAAAQFNNPRAIAFGPQSNIFVADSGNNALRRVTPAGVVTTLTAQVRPSSVLRQAVLFNFNNPRGVAVTPDGNTIYVSDTGNHRVVIVAPDGTATVFAGNGTAGFVDGVGTASQFNGPTGLSLDRNGNLYVADTGNNRIRKVTPGGTVTTLNTTSSLNSRIKLQDFDFQAVNKLTPGVTNQGVTGVNFGVISTSGLLGTVITTMSGLQTNTLASFGTRDVGVGDFNNDGIPDIAAVSVESGMIDGVQVGAGRITVLLGLGDGSFGFPTVLDSGPQTPLSITVDRFDGDAFADVAFATESEISVITLINTIVPSNPQSKSGNSGGTTGTNLITVSPLSISGTHTVGETNCPQFFQDPVVRNISDGTVTFNATVNNNVFTLLDASGTLPAGGSTSIGVAFNCTQIPPQSGIITFTAMGPNNSTQTVTLPISLLNGGAQGKNSLRAQPRSER